MINECSRRPASADVARTCPALRNQSWPEPSGPPRALQLATTTRPCALARTGLSLAPSARYISLSLTQCMLYRIEIVRFAKLRGGMVGALVKVTVNGDAGEPTASLGRFEADRPRGKWATAPSDGAEAWCAP